MSTAAIAREWTRIGLIGFGGPPTHIAMLRRLLVERERWMDAADFEDANAACGLLPGPSSTQLAILCAYRVGGPRGALVGGLGFVVPALVAVIALAALVLSSSAPLGVRGIAAGAGAGVGAVAVSAALSLAGPSHARVREDRARRLRWLAYFLAGALGAALTGAFLVLVLLACGAAELLIASGRRNGRAAGPPAGAAAAVGLPALPQGLRVVAQGRPLPLAALVAAVQAGGFPALAWTALKVGALSFGGGFVIVPLMQSDAVHSFHWMTNAQFLGAVALGQITPGPVVATVAAVGYVAHGIAGALLAGLVVFAPSFLFVLAGARRYHELRRAPRPRAFLDGAGPAAVGAILGGAYLLAAALREDWQFAVLAGAAVLLLLLRRGVVLTLLAAGAAGLLLALLGAPLPALR